MNAYPWKEQNKTESKYNSQRSFVDNRNEHGCQRCYRENNNCS